MMMTTTCVLYLILDSIDMGGPKGHKSKTLTMVGRPKVTRGTTAAAGPRMSSSSSADHKILSPEEPRNRRGLPGLTTVGRRVHKAWIRGSQSHLLHMPGNGFCPSRPTSALAYQFRANDLTTVHREDPTTTLDSKVGTSVEAP